MELAQLLDRVDRQRLAIAASDLEQPSGLHGGFEVDVEFDLRVRHRIFERHTLA
jgi:hypothetical protein